MSDEIDVSGSHGTSISRAGLIQQEGFKKSDGRFGIGVYFWSTTPYADYLAKSWWQFEFSRGKYKSDENPACAIILARFGITEDEFLDLDNKTIKNGLASLCIEKKLGISVTDRKMAAIIVAFVSRLEKKLNHKFKVMESTVSTAPKEFIDKYPLKVIGAPSCCIVFDKTCIEILSVGICS